MKSKFDKAPLNEWIDEEIPVLKHKFDSDKGKITSVYEMEKLKTMYLDVPKEKFRCKSGQHTFKCVDNRKYIFSCTKCTHSRKVYPIKYMYNEKTLQLIDKTTGLPV